MFYVFRYNGIMSETFNCIQKALLQAGMEIPYIQPSTDPVARSVSDLAAAHTLIKIEWTSTGGLHSELYLSKIPPVQGLETYGVSLSYKDGLFVSGAQARQEDVHNPNASVNERSIIKGNPIGELKAPQRPEKLPEAVSDAIACFAKS